jgi:hypothetical protein
MRSYSSRRGEDEGAETLLSNLRVAHFSAKKD